MNYNHLALYIYTDKNIKYMYFHSDAAENITRQAMLWFKFKQTKEKTQTLWQAKEVVLDMHDDEKLNRVYVTLSHNLIIRDFQPRKYSN